MPSDGGDIDWCGGDRKEFTENSERTERRRTGPGVKVNPEPTPVILREYP